MGLLETIEVPVEYLLKKNMAKLLNVNIKTLESLVRQGLPARYLGSMIRFRPSEVEEWLKGQSKILDVNQAAYSLRVMPQGILALRRAVKKGKTLDRLRIRTNAGGQAFFVQGELRRWFYSFEPEDYIYTSETHRIECIIDEIEERTGVQFEPLLCWICEEDVISEECSICHVDLCSKPQCCAEILDGVKPGAAPRRICPTCFGEYKSSFRQILHPPIASAPPKESR
jgi:Helix-turn-helix domain